jgi:hypothetical protein
MKSPDESLAGGAILPDLMSEYKWVWLVLSSAAASGVFIAAAYHGSPNDNKDC